MRVLKILKICVFIFFVGVLPSSAIDLSDDYNIVMILWRGITDAEKGFIDYFKENNITISIETYDVAGDASKIPEIIKKVKASKPDLIYTFGTTVTSKVLGTVEDSDIEKNIKDIPVVFNIVADPIGAGLVKSLNSSGRNLTGTVHLVPLDVQLNTISQLDNFKKIGVIYNPLEKNAVGIVDKLWAAANKYKYTITKAPIPIGGNGLPSLHNFEDLLNNLLAEGIDLLYLPSDSFIISNAAELMSCVNKAGIPTFSATEDPVRKGGAFMGVVSRYYNVGKFAGYKAHQILKGKSPAEIPIETLKKFTILLNMETAKMIDYYPPVSILKIAEAITSQGS